MTTVYTKLYEKDADPDSVYFLESGRVTIYLDNVDKYQINGHSLIFGVTEYLMNYFFDENCKRIETAICDQHTDVKKISFEKMINGLKNFSFLINVSMVVAKQVYLTNQIASTGIRILEEEELKNKKYSKLYYNSILSLKKEFEKRKLPWVKEIVTEFETSLTFKRGEAYQRSEEPIIVAETNSLDGNMVEYQKDTVLCEQDSFGEEMFVLRSGAIDVIIDDKKIATISEAGTIIGEMALLLGESRTATLKAKNSVVVTKIEKKELKEIADSGTDIFETLLKSLVKRHYFNMVRIVDLNSSVLEKTSVENLKKNLSDKSLSDLKKLKKKLVKVSKSKDVDFIKPIIDKFDL